MTWDNSCCKLCNYGIDESEYCDCHDSIQSVIVEIESDFDMRVIECSNWVPKKVILNEWFG